MKTTLMTIAAALVLAVSVHGAERKPNIVIIFTDDQGYGDLGCFGSTAIRTPHIDRLAKEGRRFTSFLSASSVCTPSRSALLTGCYPKRNHEPNLSARANILLFNLAVDIGEKHNLAAEKPEVVERLRRRMLEMDAAVEAGARPVWKKRND